MAFVGSLSGSGGDSNTINVTGSIIIANPGTGGLFPLFPGADTVFFVSGAIGGKAAGSRTVSVFGGDVVASGSITIGTGSITIDSNEIRFLGGAAKITSSSAGLTFFDSNNTGGKSLTELAAGGGGGGGDSVFTVASSVAAFTTSSIAIGIAAAASTRGSDVFFFVSGSTDATKNALFGGYLVTSGSLPDRDNDSALSIGYGPSSGVGLITSLNGNLVLDAAVSSRVIIDTDLEVAGTNIYAGGGGGARNIFTDNTTPTNLITIGGAGGKTTVAGGLEVTGNYISGSAGVNLTLGSSGDVTVAGDLTVTGNDIKSNTGATAITLSGGNVIIPGDLTVQGTTVTVDATTLTIEDPVIGLGFTSGSTATTAGDRGFIGGMSTGGNVALFWDNTDSTFTSARTSTGAGNDPVAITSYTPFRASSFQVGGTPGSAVAAGSAYLSSSDALNVLVNHTATTTFTKSGTAIVQITDYDGSGEGMITGNSSVNTISSLWVSGTSVNMGHTLAASGGPVPNGIKIFGGDIEGGSLRITTAGGPALNINSHSGLNQAQSLIMSGSAVTINAATSNNTNGVLIQGAGTSLARFWGSSTNTEIDLLGTTENLIDGTGNATAELGLSGSSINLRHGAGLNGVITLQRVASKYGTISYVSDGGTNYAQFASDGASTAVRIGSLQKVSLSGSILEVAAGAGAIFQTTTSGASGYLQAQSGSFTLGSNTFANAAKIVSINSNPLLLGSPGFVFITGSAARISVTGTAVVGLQRDGTSFVTFSSGSTTRNDVTVATNLSTELNLFETTATTVNAFGAATTLNFATGSTTTGTYNLVTGLAASGQTKTINIGTGGLASSTTNIVLGSALGGGTITAHEHLVPGSSNSYDLGTPDLRWRNMYTGDLHLKNERGDWTVIEEEEFLTLTNNKSGKRYKFVLEEI